METEATTEQLGRFGHHPDPAIDFCVEVEEIEAITHNIGIGFEECTNEFRERFARAFDFHVGGSAHAIAAKEVLRRCDARLAAVERKSKATPPPLTPLEEEMLAALRGVMRVADRNTVEFDAARTAIANAIAKAQAAQADNGEPQS